MILLNIELKFIKNNVIQHNFMLKQKLLINLNLNFLDKFISNLIILIINLLFIQIN